MTKSPTFTTYELELSLPNANDAPAALASLIESGFDAEILEVPGSGAWLRVVVRDAQRFNAWLDSHHALRCKLFSTDTGPMGAEVLFCDADDVGGGIIALREAGCDVALLPHRDPCGTSAIWLRISVAPATGTFFEWVRDIVEPLGGDVLEADFPRRSQPSPTEAGLA